LTCASEPELKRHSSTVTMETQGSTNSIICEADDQFGIWHPRCFCMPSYFTGSDCEYTVLQSFQQYHLCCAVRSVQNLLKMGSFLHWGVGCAAVPTLFWPQSMWLIWFQNWDNHYMANDL
jgi:hypothetical protein